MEKTSFIPKPVSAPVYKTKGLGILFTLSLAALFVALLTFGGVLFYKNILTKQVDSLNISLTRASDAFEPSFIAEVERLSKKIDLAKMLLKNHKSLAGVFQLLEQSTIANARFSSFM